MLAPNKEQIMDTSIVHTIEHLRATYLRLEQKEINCIYFDPMGYRTGFYLATPDELNHKDR